MKQRPDEALIGFGFTGLESAVYAFLLQESPATGYRIAQVIGKPAANTYKAIESLQRKGAIILDESGTRLCTPVDPEVLLTRLTKEFTQRKAHALKAFEGLGAPAIEGKMVSLTNTDHVIREAAALVIASESVLLVMGQVSLLEPIQEDLENSAGRGVDLYLITDRTFFIEDATVIVNPNLSSQSESLELGADDSSYLGAVLSGTSAQGITLSGGPQAQQLFQGLLSKVGVQLIRKTIDEDGGKKQIAKILESLP